MTSEAGLRSLELSLLGRQRLRDVRGRTSVPRVISFRPAAPSRRSRQDFGPSSYLFRASSAFETSEAGPPSLGLSLSGQQRLRDIRGGTTVPRAISFGPAVPLRHSRQGLDLLSCFFRPNNIFREFGFELRTFESFSSNLSPELSMLLNQHARILVAIY
jgi:hypothetical protein